VIACDDKYWIDIKLGLSLCIVFDGVIAYKGGVGPLHYNIDQVDSWLGSRYAK
jgi:hypothetical protein